MEIPEGFLTPEKTRYYLRFSDYTLRKFAREGKIETIRAGDKSNSHRRYNARGYAEKYLPNYKRKREKIIYSRVSTKSQKEDLERQSSYLRGIYPDYREIKDIGSGLNWKRKGIRYILEQAIKGNIEEVVVSYRDRLCRFGFELIQFILEQKGGKITVLHDEKQEPNQELVSDLISIITVFSSRIYGLRKYKKRISDEITTEDPNIQTKTKSRAKATTKKDNA